MVVLGLGKYTTLSVWAFLAVIYLLTYHPYHLDCPERHLLQAIDFPTNSSFMSKSCLESSFEHGVLYFAYHVNRNRTKNMMANVCESIKSLKRHNPCVKVAVASNHVIGTPRELQSWGIDDVVLIDQNDVVEGPDRQRGRQWWTRTLYLSRTPYNYTIQLDSDRTVCGNISEIFHQLESYDFLGVSAGILPAMDNGVMAWKKSPKIDRLLEVWKEELLKQDKLGNDQPALARALDLLPDVKAGVMNPGYQVKALPAMGEAWEAQLRV